MEDFSADIDLIRRIPAVPSILDVICRATGMGFAAVARVTEGRWIACSVLDQINFGLQPGSELQVETTICHEIRQHPSPVVIDHVAEDETYRDHHTPRQYGFQSYISVPIFLSDGKFFGTLCAIDPKPAHLNNPETIGMFQLFAELISFHIDSSEKLSRSESHLQAEREVSELREQFIGVLGHDLRNPLGALSIGSALLGQSPLNEEQLSTLAMMKRSVTRMTDLINDAMDFTRGRLGGGITLEGKTRQPLEPVLAQVIEEVQTNWPDRVIVSHFAVREAVSSDGKRLSQLFTNLLANAMNHGKADRPVTVRAHTADGKFELSVTNAADPIPPDVLQRLFEPFSRGDSKTYQKGMGLGLYIASEIAKSHGGTLRVAAVGDEVCFTFAMPC